jgi:biotin carboxyl carrier protein
MIYSVQIEDQTYQVEIKDLRARPILAVVDGVEFKIYPQNNRLPTSAARLNSPAEAPKASQPAVTTLPKASPVANGETVRAPIPGVILSILVKPGDAVAHGQELCIIEAMKMKNAIRAAHDGVIQEVLVAPGQTVNHGETLMKFAE